MTSEHFLAEFGYFWPVFGSHGCGAAYIGNKGENGRNSKKSVRSRKKSTFQKLFLIVLRVFLNPLGGYRWSKNGQKLANHGLTWVEGLGTATSLSSPPGSSGSPPLIPRRRISGAIRTQ